MDEFKEGDLCIFSADPYTIYKVGPYNREEYFLIVTANPSDSDKAGFARFSTFTGKSLNRYKDEYVEHLTKEHKTRLLIKGVTFNA